MTKKFRTIDKKSKDKYFDASYPDKKKIERTEEGWVNEFLQDSINARGIVVIDQNTVILLYEKN